MNQQLSNFLWGSIWLLAGVLTLLNLDALVLFDRHFGVRRRAWCQKHLGNSFLNRPLWSVRTPSAFPASRISKIGFRVIGILLLLVGALDLLEPVLMRLYFRSQFR
jgi:hypothetical protein